MIETPHLTAREVRLVKRLAARREIVCRMASDSDNAIRLGNGYVYFSIPGGRYIRAADIAALSGKGFFVERDDALFDGGGQTLALADPLPAYTTGRRRKAK